MIGPEVEAEVIVTVDDGVFRQVAHNRSLYFFAAESRYNEYGETS